MIRGPPLRSPRTSLVDWLHSPPPWWRSFWPHFVGGVLVRGPSDKECLRKDAIHLSASTLLIIRLAAHALHRGWTFEVVASTLTGPRAKHTMALAFELVPYLQRASETGVRPHQFTAELVETDQRNPKRVGKVFQQIHNLSKEELGVSDIFPTSRGNKSDTRKNSEGFPPLDHKHRFTRS